MKSLGLVAAGGSLCILCIGAHSDDIEIGAGGTILALIAAGVRLEVDWCVLSAPGGRKEEARASANALLAECAGHRMELGSFHDSHFPSQSTAIKEWLSAIREKTAPDVIFTHRLEDAHQDHREIAKLTWNLFRDHLILEYEVPKWDGDLAALNAYVPLSKDILERKIALLDGHFASQRSKDWFDAETFRGLARLRGMECRAPEHYAEAFMMRKLRLL
ncbi:PIG-L deacetylase family protein [Chelativorans intermedius]|uniref:PIG-L deacetylase family protein n=1 Tax=Chelativorans intermedius TaxID=515947 RepID=A0ABV6D677_9HYPH|nr:PIG-L deacetylase family protein [Chelativorans intermedius]MCT8999399.1 PIG-L family deacetylase [Chelativorans intermedius]